MQILYEARDRIEAQMLIDDLKARDIEAVVLGDYLAGGAGELSALNFPAVWVVHAQDMERAKSALEVFLQAQRAGGASDWRCPSCQVEVGPAFEVCWNCGAGRPE